MPISDDALARWESGQPIAATRQPLRRVPPKPPKSEPPKGRPKTSDYLTVHEVAADLTVSPMTIYRLISTGDLRAHRIGRSFRIRRADYEDWLDGTATA